MYWITGIIVTVNSLYSIDSVDIVDSVDSIAVTGPLLINQRARERPICGQTISCRHTKHRTYLDTGYSLAWHGGDLVLEGCICLCSFIFCHQQSIIVRDELFIILLSSLSSPLSFTQIILGLNSSFIMMIKYQRNKFPLIQLIETR